MDSKKTLWMSNHIFSNAPNCLHAAKIRFGTEAEVSAFGQELSLQFNGQSA